jgi:uncharacterized membrane protein YcaP (DUF421 family)
MEIVLRASVMFLVVYGLLRLMGKRELGQLAPFELVTLIVMGDLIQQGVTHQDFSMTGATLAILTFAGWSLAFNALSHAYPRLRRALEGSPVVLMRDGQLLKRNLNREGVDEDEFSAEMRLAGIARLDQVAWAILEPQGRIAFIRKDDGDVDPRGDEAGAAA